METENKSKFITELPAKIQVILKSTDFPVKRNDIIERARKTGAIPDILREIGMLPDREYDSSGDVAEELHKIYLGVPS